MEAKLKTTSIVLLIMTTIWVVLTVISMSGTDPGWSDGDYVVWVADPDIYFTLNYINVTLLTLIVMLLYLYLFNYLKALNRRLALAVLLLVPVYGALNLFSYSIQIFLVPGLARAALEQQGDLTHVSSLVQANSNSLVGLLNGIAYAVLGIPSIVYGFLLFRSFRKYSGIFLLLNGLLCLLGLLGYLTDLSLLSMGVMVGGIFFLISLLFMTIEFKRNLP